ncbi:MAG: hypothetical protein HQ492_12490 [Woeseiaceae bacterium]|nr:hypothetical protein [Woeseiaceae bacterium]
MLRATALAIVFLLSSCAGGSAYTANKLDAITGVTITYSRAPMVFYRDGFESIVIFADGEPLSLELSGWTAATIGAGEPVYLKPVSSAADAYYEVTIDHLRMIVASNKVRILTTGPKPKSFEEWNQQSTARASFKEFLDRSVY